jgi:hypothetical protein
MKSSIVRTLVTLSLTAVLSPVALMAQGPIQAKIPFDFTVGDKSFAAGNYRVQEVNHGVIRVQNAKDLSAIISLVTPADRSKRADQAVLTFNRYGDRYFLYKVSSGDQAWQFHKSHAEKEIIAKSGSPKPVVVAAALRSK